jgi:putative FmdB family regulatory protein
MPLFEYSCAKCGERFEALLKSAADRPAGCPACGSRRVGRQFSTFAAAVNTLSDSVPCASGACPTSGGGRRSACASGACPFG